MNEFEYDNNDDHCQCPDCAGIDRGSVPPYDQDKGEVFYDDPELDKALGRFQSGSVGVFWWAWDKWETHMERIEDDPTYEPRPSMKDITWISGPGVSKLLIHSDPLYVQDN